MKCGVCGSDKMNVYGSDHKTILRQRVMRNASDVWTHKSEMHKEEVRASGRKATERRKEKEQVERDKEQQRKELRAAASQVAIWPQDNSWRRDGDKVVYNLTTTAEMHISAGGPETMYPARYPEPEIMEAYHDLQAEIVRLQAEGKDMLKRAWEAGITITEADIDAVKAAGEVVV